MGIVVCKIDTILLTLLFCIRLFRDKVNVLRVAYAYNTVAGYLILILKRAGCPAVLEILLQYDGFIASGLSMWVVR